MSVQTKSIATGLSFDLPQPNCIPIDFSEYIHAEWLDHVPRSTSSEIFANVLEINHNYKESLRIVVPWELDGLGIFFLKTVSLPRREKRYDLVLEIARGTVGRLVDQTENWIAAGLELAESIHTQIKQAKSDFKLATFSEGMVRFELSNQAIATSVQLMEKVGRAFAEYIFELREKENQPNTALIGCQLDPESGKIQKSLEQTFNAAVLPIPEFDEPDLGIAQQIESLCFKLHRKGITSCTEPLFRFSSFRKQDFDSVESAESYLLEAGKKSLRQCGNDFKLLFPISEIGFREADGWSDQEQIHLSFELMRMIKNERPSVPLLIGINQPFGESLTLSSQKISPIQLADNLIRMDTPIAAFCLEFNLGYYPKGTWARDLFAFNDLLDSWAHFDFPLVIQLRVPGGVQKSNQPNEERTEMAAALDSQANWIRQITLLALAKQNVAGVFYGNLIDQVGDQYFGSGLFTNQLQEKPAVQVLREIRQAMK